MIYSKTKEGFDDNCNKGMELLIQREKRKMRYETSCRGSRSGTTANKINPYYLIGSIFFIFIFFILIFQWLITGGTLAYKGSPIAIN